MNLKKVWQITRHEFLYNLQRKSYIFSAFVVPILITFISYLSFYQVDQTENDVDQFQTVGYVNHVAELPLEEIASERFITFVDETSARASFEAKDIQAYFVINADYLSTGTVAYYSDLPMRSKLIDEFSDFLQTGVAELNSEPTTTARLIDPITLEIQIGDEPAPISQETALFRLALPIALGLLFVFNVLITSQFLMTGIVEEKENYILEILLSSCRAIELITGKVLGLGGLALLQLVFWLSMGLGMGAFTGSLDSVQSIRPDLTILLIAGIYFVLTFLMFSGVMIGIGCVASAEQESRQITSFIIMIAILPIMLSIGSFDKNPDGAWVTFLSLFPLTSPLTMMILLGLGTAKTWQVALSLLILTLSIGGVLWISSTVFRTSMLSKGYLPYLRQLKSSLRGQP